MMHDFRAETVLKAGPGEGVHAAKALLEAPRRRAAFALTLWP